MALKRGFRTRISGETDFPCISDGYPVKSSSWVAIRIYQSSHTNPVFVTVDKKPIYDKKSAEWCRKAVDQCWRMKKGQIAPNEIKAASEAYDHARKIYEGCSVNND
ncbi:MAG: hypothetical protein WKF87_08825 [Chryseolinea sp.]